MVMSPFDSTIAMSSRKVRKNGQSRAIPRSVCSWPASTAACRPLPTPYQPGMTARAWLQANTQGIARRLPSAASWPSRRDGREPSVIRSITSIGVAVRK